jgi:hypothetical protein
LLAPVAVKLALAPTQIEGEPVIVSEGRGFTTSEIVPGIALTQPRELVPFTTYTVDDGGQITLFDPVSEPGFQV